MLVVMRSSISFSHDEKYRKHLEQKPLCFSIADKGDIILLTIIIIIISGNDL